MKHLFLALALIALTGCETQSSMPSDGLHKLEKVIPQSLEETAINLQLYNKRCNRHVALEFYVNDKTRAYNPGFGAWVEPAPIEYEESEDGASTTVFWYLSDNENMFKYLTHGLTNPEKCAEDYTFTERMFTGVGES